MATDYDKERQYYERRIQELQDKTLQSSGRSLGKIISKLKRFMDFLQSFLTYITTSGMIHESEQIGMNTATELERQREVLEKTKNQLDNIDSTLKESQKDINKMKSFFYRVKYSFGSKKKVDPTESQVPSSDDKKKPITLSEEDQDDRYRNHPTTRMRSDPPETSNNNSNSFDQKLSEDLDEISDGLSRLKSLALTLGNEVEASNSLIDDIGTGMQNVDIKIKGQNKEINKMLNRKEPESNSSSIPGASAVTGASTTFKIMKFFK